MRYPVINTNEKYYNAIKGECQMKKEKVKISYTNTSVSGYSEEYKKSVFFLVQEIKQERKAFNIRS